MQNDGDVKIGKARRDYPKEIYVVKNKSNPFGAGDWDGAPVYEDGVKYVRSDAEAKPVTAHSKSEYKRLTAQGADVAPPGEARDYQSSLIDSLKDKREAVAYLQAALEEDQDGFLMALRNVAEAHGLVLKENDTLRAKLKEAAEAGLQACEQYRAAANDNATIRDTFTKFVNDVAAATGAPDWEYPGQIVRDVALLKDSLDKARIETGSWFDAFYKLKKEADTLRTQLAQAQNETLERAAQECIAELNRENTSRSEVDAYDCAKAIRALKTTRSTE